MEKWKTESKLFDFRLAPNWFIHFSIFSFQFSIFSTFFILAKGWVSVAKLAEP